MRALAGVGFDARLVHTGQHYDKSLSESILEQLDVPKPIANLKVGSGSHVWQISEVMRRLEPVLASEQPRAVVVAGDVNSTLAAALTAEKMGFPVAHVEAGLRSRDRTMPEEANRILTDAVSRWLFASEQSAAANLQQEGFDENRIHFVGNVMIDALMQQRDQAIAEHPHERFGLQRRGYVVLTLHRPSNVDDEKKLRIVLAAAERLNSQTPVLFLLHPRTRARLENLKYKGQLLLSDPVDYRTMLGLMEGARGVVTDSGGVQEETTVLGTPCITLRDNTERPATVDVGANRLASVDEDAIVAAVQGAFTGERGDWPIPDLWDGRASLRIAQILHRDLGS
jgi:UDP-N-acetylglucosamine 2-epimerase (non-hydrolysing)